MTSKKKKPLSMRNFSPEKQRAILSRIDFVEQLLNSLLDDSEKGEIKKRYMEETGCTERTIRNHLKRYREQGTHGLILYESQKDRKPLCSPELEEKIIALIKENPKRTIPKIRELLIVSDDFREEASRISDRQLYRVAHKNGLDSRGRSFLLDNIKRSYRSFEASCSLELVQGDARDGIWIECPDGKRRKTYLFAWIDDYSRKILYAQYYWDEKLPRMEDSFRKMVLRYGIPKKLYLDNGSVYVSHHFWLVLRDLEIKKIHHPPYKAHCKGKVEVCMKRIKYDFQDEAQNAGFKTLEELNSAFFAWVDLKYDRQALSTTGEPPGERFIKGLTATPERVENFDEFMQYFLFRETRTVNKYGRVKVKGNSYPVKTVLFGTVVNVRFDPFDLSKIFIYDESGNVLEAAEAISIKNLQDPYIPEESKEPVARVQESARNYFESLRKLHIEEQRKAMPNLPYNKIRKKEEDDEK